MLIPQMLPLCLDFYALVMISMGCSRFPHIGLLISLGGSGFLKVDPDFFCSVLIFMNLSEFLHIDHDFQR